MTIALTCVVKAHSEFSEDEIEAALYIGNPLVAIKENGLSVILDHKFYLQLAKCVKAKSCLRINKSIDFLEGELISEGFEIVSNAIINNLTASHKNSFLDN